MIRATRIGLVVSLCSLSFVGLGGTHQAPPHTAIERAYFKCDASRSLEGGIYGKGPFKRFGPKESACSSKEWVPIAHTEFKRLATEWYGHNWSNEIPFWVEAK